ncbi:hypothetical protein P872_11915 [Rhodonellum psychrophilum GCM71 = DSM 17998]|uniref:Uncharacterized protein n=1 Tax=Rhodonellum psychrophilum GCM71 = DSM 17998 TaxID=1123057 RepID=U5BW94_9BACT|nr:hypothetical protein P872_11915 [Rhodonellum psychrophilum GCM71 = DSM 17998]
MGSFTLPYLNENPIFHAPNFDELHREGTLSIAKNPFAMVRAKESLK